PALTGRHDLGDQLFPRVEVVVQRGRTHRRELGDVHQPRCRVALLAQQGGRGLQNAIPRRSGSVLGVLGVLGAVVVLGCHLTVPSPRGMPQGMEYPPLTENTCPVTCRAARSEETQPTDAAMSCAVVRRRSGICLRM